MKKNFKFSPEEEETFDSILFFLDELRTQLNHETLLTPDKEIMFNQAENAICDIYTMFNDDE